eukprot:1146904-Pelagomonas_calceolata.AAC.1
MGTKSTPTHIPHDLLIQNLGDVKGYKKEGLQSKPLIAGLYRMEKEEAVPKEVKPRSGIAGNEYANAIAKYQANEANKSVADTGIPSAGPFSQILWSAKEGKKRMLRTHPQLLPLANKDISNSF